MRAVLKEALRLNPVLAGNARQTGKDVVLDGYQVPQGVSYILKATHSIGWKNVFFQMMSLTHIKMLRFTDRSSNGHSCFTK